MTKIIEALAQVDVAVAVTEAFALKFFEDADYEFVGGGTATNGY